MGETAKTFCVLFIMIGLAVSALAWVDDFPDDLKWGFGIGGGILIGLAMGLFLYLHFRRDLEHDYLHEYCNNFLNHHGFCFVVGCTAYDGIAFLEIYFQSQRDVPCVGGVSLRLETGTFSKSSSSRNIRCEMECPPAGFGVARIPIALAEKWQGKREKVQVGASVRYPEGKGHVVRFRDGVFVRANMDFRNSSAQNSMLGNIIADLYFALLGMPSVTTTIDFPTGVATEIPEHLSSQIEIFWQQGDPPFGDEGPRY
ncbi:MAG: hypothetical protein KDA84_28435 [Planctomycetaceae bacterium]|nr:hypothetical protein [Planctomycetaceae bacterium]